MGKSDVLFYEATPKRMLSSYVELGILPFYQKFFLYLTVLLRILIVLWRRRISRFSKPNEYLYGILEQDVDEDMILGSINYLEVYTFMGVLQHDTSNPNRQIIIFT